MSYLDPSIRVDLDLGDMHTLRYFSWDPDLELNPQYQGIADVPVEKAGAIVGHFRPDDSSHYCEGGVTFDIPQMRAVNPNGTFWTVESWEPLTLSPSLLCKAPLFDPDTHKPIPNTECGDHGFIREGKWVRA